MIDRKVTLAVLVTLLLQLAAGLLWAGAAAERIDAVELELERRRPVVLQTARIEAELSLMRTQLARIERKMDRADD